MKQQSYGFAEREPVAYAFLLTEDKQERPSQGNFIQLFYSSTDARNALAHACSELQVLISDHDAEVSPLNLAAALHKDNHLRDIYLQKSEPNGLFVSRLEAAGARGVMTLHEAEQLLNMLPAKESTLQQTKENANDEFSEADFEELCSTAPQNEMRLASPAPDLTWLEQALELDELDELPTIAGSVLVETAPVLSALDQESIRPARRPEIASESQSDRKGCVAAFVSGRGGVGKSSLAVLTGIELWRSGTKVILVDMDLQFGDMSILAGNEQECSIQRLGIEQLCHDQMRVPRVEGSLLLIEAAQSPELAEELVSFLPQLLSDLRSAADIVLINTSCLWNEATAVLARSTDKLIVCMDQRATSISAARLLVELCMRLQIPSTQLSYLLNRCARNAPITSIDASLAMGGVDIITIAEGGTDVDELLSLGCPLELLSAQQPLRQSVHDLGMSLLGGWSRDASFGGR